MAYSDQITEMRELIRTELVPRIIFMGYHEGRLDYFKCRFCDVITPVDDAHSTIYFAKHSTYCKLGKVTGVIE